TAPWDMVLDEHTGVLEWFPDNADVGDTTVTFTVTDVTNRSTSQTFALHIINANDAIQIVSVADTIALEDEAYIYAVETLDDDLNDQARFSLSIAPVGMSIDSLNGRISWFPTNDNVGDTVVTFSVIDDSGSTDSQSYNLHVLNINDIPVIHSIADTIAIEDQLYTYSVIATDDDLGDQLDFSLFSAPSAMIINDSTGVITWLPDNDDVGDTLVTIIVSDDSSTTDIQSFVLSVSNVNDPPVLISTIPNFTVDEDAADTSFALFEIFYDDDISSVDDSLEFSLTNSDPSVLNASIDRDTLFLDYLDNQNGSVNLSITATDKPSASVTENFTSTIVAVNDAPSGFNLVTPDAIVFYDSVITFDWAASLDPDVATNADQLFYTFRYSSTEDFNTYSDIEDIIDTTLTLDQPFIQDQSYYWKVRVEDFYRVKIWSNEVRRFSLNYEDNPPETPDILSSANAVVDIDGFISWSQSQDEDLGDSVSYVLEIASDDQFSEILTGYTGSDTVVSLVDLSHSDLIENAQHYLRVRAFDTDTLYSSWTEVMNFYWDNVNEAPDQVTSLLTPADEIVTTLSPSFQWQMSSDIDPGDASNSLGYTASVWSAADTTSFTTEPGDTSHYLATDLTENEIYQWAVQAYDAGGLLSSVSDTANFWVNSQNEDPGPFSLLAPSGDTLDTSHPTFTWSMPIDPDVGTSLSYNLRYSLSETFDSYSEVEGISDTNYTLIDSLDDDLQYFWKIEAQDEFGATVWSQNTLSFVVNAVNVAPTAPSAPDIEPYTILNLGDPMSWTPSYDGDPGDVVIYQVVILSDSTLSDTMECGHESTEGLVLYCYYVSGSATIITQEIITAITQSENGICYGTIRAIDQSGLPGAWSPMVPFYVDTYNEAPLPPTPFGIVSGSILNTQTPQFTFEAGWDPDPRDPIGSLVYGGTCWNGNDVREFIIGYDTTYVIDTLWENSGYWVCFWARDTSGLYSANSDTTFFWVNSVNESPESFILLEPLSDTLDTSYPAFRWQASTDPDINAVLSYT
ncbi:MAG: hypothetical protein HN590_00810, partial [Calditrichaeota bacterium]|nr:hypothetical protein [Calditrichota bacterium]